MITIVGIALCVIFFSYLIYIYIRFGQLSSISESSYKLKEQGYQFTIFLCLLGTPTFALETGWFFFGGAFLFFCGLAAEYKEKLTSTVHYIGASGSIALYSVGLAVEGIYYPLILIPIAGVVLRKIKNKTYWIEFISFVLIVSGMFWLDR